MKSNLKVVVGFVLAAIILIGLWSMTNASGDIPATGNGGSPTPVWDIPEETAQPTIYIEELPSTGAGTTAKDVKIDNHTGWVFIGYSCVWYGGPTGKYAVYGYAYIHSSSYPQHLYSQYYSVRISPWC